MDNGCGLAITCRTCRPGEKEGVIYPRPLVNKTENASNASKSATVDDAALANASQALNGSANASANTTACVPNMTCDAELQCGEAPNGCGGVLKCGNSSGECVPGLGSPHELDNMVCTPEQKCACVPDECNNRCGEFYDGCS